jgi:5-oxopent-3-ene-1,2,5-tricarboxylate decarboxylase/2-hydroxyhepta-2,4-diene-1,7-dioate isomerase
MTLPAFAMAPYRLSGAVYGAAMNHRGALAALGDAVHRPPYKAPPSGVVLYIKPSNTLIAAGDGAQVDDAAPELEVGAALGLVIGRTACAVREADALDHVAGYLVVADFSVPHDSFFRPQIRFKARDASCAFGAAVVSRRSVDHPDALAVRVYVDGRLAQATTTGDHVRGAARLLADVSDFMTLNPGDVLLTGVAPGAPRVGAGAEVAIEIDGVGRLQVRVAHSERAS